MEALPQRLQHFTTARDARPKGVWETIESNMEVFNVKKLPLMLVPIAAMSKAEQADQRVGHTSLHWALVYSNVP